MLKHSPWKNSLQLFKGTLDRIVVRMEFGTIHEYYAVAKILEEKAMWVRFLADEILRNEAEVQSMERGFERSASLIDNGR